jgi:hypothetical protein
MQPKNIKIDQYVEVKKNPTIRMTAARRIFFLSLKM